MTSSIADQVLSTRTIIADMNVQFYHDKIFEKLPVNVNLPNYKCKIIAMYHKNTPKGDCSYFNKKKLSSFRNAVNIIIKDTEENCFNIKLSDKGKFQISGAKHLESTYHAIQYLIVLIIKTCKECIIYKKENYIKISFTTVMTNFVYNAGFKIDKEKLNHLMKKDKTHNFYNLFETSFGYTGLNLKLRMNPNDYKIKIPVYILIGDQWIKEEKEYLPMGKSEKFNSFLVFHSGKIICSGMMESTMNNAFQVFSNYINKNKKLIKEVIL